MGNNATRQQQCDIKYVQTLDDQNFGQVDIYKNQEGKYIMMLTRTFMKDNTNQYKDNGFHELLEYTTTHPQSQQYFTPILHTTAKVENLCVVYQIIDTYCQYYNFTLEDMIKYRKQMDKEEIWLTFYWMVRFIALIKKQGWAVQGGLRLGRVFLTLKGMPTVSIHHLIKSSSTDLVFQKQQNLLEQVALGILQLACMTKLSINDNLELHLRKTQKIDQYLGQILGNILRKSVVTKPKKIQDIDVISRIQQLLAEQKIAVSKQIKLNKFKYIIPKPPSTPILEQPFKHQKNNVSPSTPSLPSMASSASQANVQQSQTQQKQKPIIINSLGGRKNKQNSSLRSSMKRDQKTLPMLDLFENGSMTSPATKLFALETPSSINMNMNATISMNSSTNANNTKINASTNMNKTMSVKNALLMDDIENRKRQTQRQIQKMWERKQMIMKTTQKQDKTQNQKNNKQNVLGNSIRQVRPSYSRTQKQPSWSKKVLNDHLHEKLKQSNHRS